MCKWWVLSGSLDGVGPLSRRVSILQVYWSSFVIKKTRLITNKSYVECCVRQSSDCYSCFTDSNSVLPCTQGLLNPACASIPILSLLRLTYLWPWREKRSTSTYYVLNQYMHPYVNIKISLQSVEKGFTVHSVLLGSYHWGHCTTAQHHLHVCQPQYTWINST